MRKSTKIWLILMIVSNIALLYFYQPFINSLTYINGKVALNLNWEFYIGVAMFALANISGFFVIGRFIKAQSFSGQIFFNTLFPTITFVLLLYFFYNITTMEQIGIVALIRDSLNINTTTARYIWIGIVCATYLLYLFITYIFLSRPIKRVERALQKLKYGETNKNLNIGSAKEFQNIEEDLKKLNLKLIDYDSNRAVQTEISKES
ncbi:MAG: hypothetical protein J5779_00955 [Clostridia bacterium]|nr:hypothetical protein [Clostridia bacterium]